MYFADSQKVDQEFINDARSQEKAATTLKIVCDPVLAAQAYIWLKSAVYKGQYDWINP
jgi:hypothetical protein